MQWGSKNRVTIQESDGAVLLSIVYSEESVSITGSWLLGVQSGREKFDVAAVFE